MHDKTSLTKTSLARCLRRRIDKALLLAYFPHDRCVRAGLVCSPGTVGPFLFRHTTGFGVEMLLMANSCRGIRPDQTT